MNALTLQAIAQDTIAYPIPSLRDNSTLISAVQSTLNRIGFSVGNVDGKWNWNTDNAYRAFAHKYGFPVDELSPRAANLLLSLGRSQPTPPTKPPTPTPPAPSLFEEALKFTLRWEGGYADHPSDQGGPTNHGITTATYRTYRQRKGLPVQNVKLISDAEVREIYEAQYWQASQCSLKKRPLAIVHFDTAVNFGVGGSTIFLQQALKVPVDQVYGPVTRAALSRADHLEVAKRYCQLRIDFRHRRVSQNPKQQVFLKGWLNRDNELLRYISAL